LGRVVSGPLKSIMSHCCRVRSKKLLRHQHDCCSRLHCSRLAGGTHTFTREVSDPCDAACRQNSLRTC